MSLVTSIGLQVQSNQQDLSNLEISWFQEQLKNIEKYPPEQSGLIAHAFTWFNWLGDPKFKLQLSKDVKKQVIEACYSYIDGNGNLYARNFSLENLSIPDQVMLYRILDSYLKLKSREEIDSIICVLDLIENKLIDVLKNANQKEEIINSINSETDETTNHLKKRLGLDRQQEGSLVIQNESGKLPNEVLHRIFIYLDATDLRNITRVCKLWRDVMLNTSNLNVLLNQLKDLPSFKEKRILQTPNSSPYDDIFLYSKQLVRKLRHYQIELGVLGNTNPAILPSLVFIQKENELKKLQDESLVYFCNQLPEEVTATLPSLALEEISSIEQAELLREELKNSEIVKNLTELDLSSCEISYLPEEIRYFENLKKLDLHNNQLTSFSGEGLSSLTELVLNNNQLTSFSGEGLSSLTRLWLYENKLSSFSGDGLGSLTQLFLSHNELTSFSSDGLRSLKHLMLTSNRITSFSGEGLNLLTDLLLNYNQLTSFSGEGLTSLNDLDLCSNQLTSFSAEGLGSLKKLDLRNNQLTSFSGKGLGSSTQLLIYRNQLTSFSAEGVNSLTELNLDDNPLTSFSSVGTDPLTQLNLPSSIPPAEISPIMDEDDEDVDLSNSEQSTQPPLNNTKQTSIFKNVSGFCMRISKGLKELNCFASGLETTDSEEELQLLHSHLNEDPTDSK